MVRQEGLEPSTHALKGRYSTNWVIGAYGDPYQTWTGVLLRDRQAWYSSSPMGHIVFTLFKILCELNYEMLTFKYIHGYIVY